MNNVPIYSLEKKDGFDENSLSNNSLSYLVPIESIKQKKIESFTQASQDHIKNLFKDNKDHSTLDLYDLSSILVSTVWNQNDDVFDRREVWVSRHTPIHKPLNVEHNCNDIVGHMVDVCAIDNDLQLISENSTIDELPLSYHLLTKAVLYKMPKTKNEERMAKICEEVKNNEWFVSVEALFSDFDYALQSSENKIKIVERNEETSFLTKHLRIYGGKGEFNEYKIGRILRNIVFSGKGLVKNPANPQSIIFAKKHNFESAVYLSSIELSKNNGVNKMDEQVKALEKTVEFLKDQVSKLETSLSESNEKIKNLDAEVKNRNDKISALEGSLKSSNEEIVTARTKIDEIEKNRNELKNSLDKIEAEKKYNERLNSIASKLSIDAEKAKRILDTVNTLDQVSFEAFLVSQIELIKAKNVTVATTITDSQKADTKVLETLEKPADKELALNTKADNFGVEQVRNNIVKYLSEFLGAKTEKKEN